MYIYVFVVQGRWHCVRTVVASKDCFAGEKKVNKDGDVTYIS